MLKTKASFLNKERIIQTPFQEFYDPAPASHCWATQWPPIKRQFLLPLCAAFLLHFAVAVTVAVAVAVRAAFAAKGDDDDIKLIAATVV